MNGFYGRAEITLNNLNINHPIDAEVFFLWLRIKSLVPPDADSDKRLWRLHFYLITNSRLSSADNSWMTESPKAKKMEKEMESQQTDKQTKRKCVWYPCQSVHHSVVCSFFWVKLLHIVRTDPESRNAPDEEREEREEEEEEGKTGRRRAPPHCWICGDKRWTMSHNGNMLS